MKSTQTAMRPPVVLVADDVGAIRRSLGRLLSHAGYQVVLAEGGHQALAYLRSNVVDCLVIDTDMPEINGWAVLDAIRVSAAVSCQRVILLDPSPRIKAVAKACALGVSLVEKTATSLLDAIGPAFPKAFPKTA